MGRPNTTRDIEEHQLADICCSVPFYMFPLNPISRHERGSLNCGTAVSLASNTCWPVVTVANCQAQRGCFYYQSSFDKLDGMRLPLVAVVLLLRALPFADDCSIVNVERLCHNTTT
jgi:hypothetical protein